MCNVFPGAFGSLPFGCPKRFQCIRCYAHWILAETALAEKLVSTPSKPADEKKRRMGPGPNSGGMHSNFDAELAQGSTVHSNICPQVPSEAAIAMVPPFPTGDAVQDLVLQVTSLDDSLSYGASGTPLPDPSTNEPLRALNLYLSRAGGNAKYTETEQAPFGTW